MFDTKKLNRENPYYLALLKTIMKSKDVVKTRVNTLKGPEAFSLNSVSGLLIAMKCVEFLLALAGQ